CKTKGSGILTLMGNGSHFEVPNADAPVTKAEINAAIAALEETDTSEPCSVPPEIATEQTEELPLRKEARKLRKISRSTVKREASKGRSETASRIEALRRELAEASTDGVNQADDSGRIDGGDPSAAFEEEDPTGLRPYYIHNTEYE